MYIVVVGGGKVGYYLTKTLVTEGYEVLLIERDAAKVQTWSERFGAVVLHGDGCEVAVLDKAGLGRADVLIATTGNDEDNLVIAQLGQHRFTVPKVIARVNNPKNEEIFRLLGVTYTVSQTNIILNRIEEEIPHRPLIHLSMLRHGDLAIVEVDIERDAPVVGQEIRAVRFPPDTIVAAVVRENSLVMPRGETRFEAGDRIIALTHRAHEGMLRDTLVGETTA
ncbi:MAG: TrkA family potassium uptake protein [Thermomicrobia bacterium]|nr:TrkA family potassium uptake protein [Thermomicrobia bacterium]